MYILDRLNCVARISARADMVGRTELHEPDGRTTLNCPFARYFSLRRSVLSDVGCGRLVAAPKTSRTTVAVSPVSARFSISRRLKHLTKYFSFVLCHRDCSAVYWGTENGRKNDRKIPLKAFYGLTPVLHRRFNRTSTLLMTRITVVRMGSNSQRSSQLK